MITENLSTLKIHKLTQAQYDRELEAGNIDETALYLTPDDDIDLSGYATKEELDEKSDADHNHDDIYYTETEIDAKLDTLINGVIINVPTSGWVVQDDGTYINTVAIEELSGDKTLDINLYGDEITEEQAEAFDELVVSIDVEDGQIVFTSSAEITVDFNVLIRGRMNGSITSSPEQPTINITDEQIYNVSKGINPTEYYEYDTLYDLSPDGNFVCVGTANNTSSFCVLLELPYSLENIKDDISGSIWHNFNFDATFTLGDGTEYDSTTLLDYYITACDAKVLSDTKLLFVFSGDAIPIPNMTTGMSVYVKFNTLTMNIIQSVT